MERPTIKEKKVLAYVEQLEKRVDEFHIDGIRYRSYRAMIKTIEDINSLLVSEHTLKDLLGEEKQVDLVSWETMGDKDDKLIDRVKILMKELPGWIDEAEVMLEKITKEVAEKEEIRYKNKISDYFS